MPQLLRAILLVCLVATSACSPRGQKAPETTPPAGAGTDSTGRTTTDPGTAPSPQVSTPSTPPTVAPGLGAIPSPVSPITH
jgi:hypothetical protein